jgi:DNA-directed RNA polymerase subunit RPC12/RpoP
MSATSISLNCKNCGAALSVYEDMDRFACGYCGTELLVERRGGTVCLKRIESIIEGVREGTDKTAAELAAVRLSRELGQLIAAEQAYQQEAASSFPPVRESNRGCALQFFALALLIYIPLQLLSIETLTTWALYGEWLRPTVWLAFGGGTISAIVMLIRARQARRHAHEDFQLRAEQAIAARQDGMAEVRTQIERVRLKLAENRRILDA